VFTVLALLQHAAVVEGIRTQASLFLLLDSGRSGARHVHDRSFVCVSPPPPLRAKTVNTTKAAMRDPSLRSRAASIKRPSAERSGPDPSRQTSSTSVLGSFFLKSGRHGCSRSSNLSPKSGKLGCSRPSLLSRARAFSALSPKSGRLGCSCPSLLSRARAFSALPPLTIRLGWSRLSLLYRARVFSALLCTHYVSTVTLRKPRISAYARTTALANNRASHGPPRASGQQTDAITACDVTTPRAHRPRRIPKDSIVSQSKTEHRACALHSTSTARLCGTYTRKPHFAVYATCK